MKDIFISYARSDGREFAAKLREQLVNEDFSIWHDVVSMEGGEEWWPQIKEAIEGVQTMALVITPAALDSKYVRREWVHARRVGTRIMPIVADPDLALDALPRWMSRVDLFILTEGHPDRADAEKRFLKQLGEPYRRRPTPFMALALPEHFTERPAKYDELMAALLDENFDTRNVAVALRGAGGFGKTTLALRLCHDPEIVEAFTGGILWATIGERGQKIADKLTAMVSALTGTPAAFNTAEEAAARLHELLADRECLMVLDDVWDVAHIRLFTGQDSCTRLITTRDPEVVARASAEPIIVGEMKSTEAVGLLVEWLPEKHRPAKYDAVAHEALTELARRLGEWPLLVEIFAGTLRDEMNRGRSLVQALEWVNEGLEEEGLVAFDRADSEEHNQALAASMRASTRRYGDDQKQRLYELSIFPDDTAIPIDVAVRLWKATTKGELSSFTARKLLRDLAGHFFQMRVEEEDKPEALRFHDAMRAYLAGELGEEGSREAHGALLASYHSEGASWHKIEHDGYLYDHLAHHLIEAGRIDELYPLLTGSPDWMGAKFIACTGDVSTVADLDLAMGQEPDLLTLTQLHAARQVVHARVGVYTDTNLKTLVWLERKVEALAHARLRSEAKGRFDGVMTVYRACKEHGVHDAALAVEALAVEALAVEALAVEALAVARGIEDDPFGSRADALSAVAGAMAQAGDPRAAGTFEEALAVARGIEHAWRRADALSAVAGAMAQAGAFEEALAVARGIEDDPFGSRADVLSAVAAAMAQAGAFEEALAVARGIDVSSRAEALRAVAAAMAQAGAFEEALDALGPRAPSDFVQALASWAEPFEQVEPGLSLAVLREATRIVGWVQPNWQPIYEILAKGEWGLGLL